MALAQAAGRAAAGEPGGLRLERGPRKALEGCGQESGLNVKSGGDTLKGSKLESDVTDIFAASLWLEWVGRNKWSRAS